MERPSWPDGPVPISREETENSVVWTIGDKRDLAHLFIEGKFSDKLCIRKPDDWVWDILPMKNHKIRDGQFPSFGMMLEGDERTIYADDKKTVLFQYKDIDELLAAGWIVD